MKTEHILRGTLRAFHGTYLDLHRLLGMDLVHSTNILDSGNILEVIKITYHYQLRSEPIEVKLLLPYGPAARKRIENHPLNILTYMPGVDPTEVATMVDGIIQVGVFDRDGQEPFFQTYKPIIKDPIVITESLAWAYIKRRYLSDLRKWNEWKTYFEAFKIDNHA